MKRHFWIQWTLKRVDPSKSQFRKFDIEIALFPSCKDKDIIGSLKRLYTEAL